MTRLGRTTSCWCLRARGRCDPRWKKRRARAAGALSRQVAEFRDRGRGRARDCGLVPKTYNENTGLFPVKLFEILACGVPAVLLIIRAKRI